MSEDFVKELNEQAGKMLEPMTKMGELAVANFEKLGELQVESLKSYQALTVAQLRAALKVKDVEGLKTYLNAYNDFLQTVGEKVAADVKALVDLGNETGVQVTKIAEEALGQPLPRVA